MLTFLYEKPLITLLSLSILSGCAMLDYGKPLDSDYITVEIQGSQVADVGRVNVYAQDNGSLIRGEVRSKRYDRLPIPGHVDIEIIDAKGEIVFKDVLHYKRRSIRSFTADFSIELSPNIPKGSHLLITHHEFKHREDCTASKSNGKI